MPDSLNILVLGDVNYDSIYVPRYSVQLDNAQFAQKWQKESHHYKISRKGGACLLAEIIKQAVEADSPDKNIKVLGMDLPDTSDLDNSKYLESLATFETFPKNPDEAEKGESVYRLSSKGLYGWIINDKRQDIVQKRTGWLRLSLFELTDKFKQENKNEKYQLIIIHDHNNGYRNLDPRESVTPFIDDNFKNSGVIIWHMDSPIGKKDDRDNKLWNFLISSKHAKQTVVVISAGDLRDSGSAVADELPFETITRQFREQLDFDPLNDLQKFQSIVVRFSNGFIHYYSEANNKKLNFSLLPNAFLRSSSYISQASDGWMTGYSFIYVSAITRAIVNSIIQEGNIEDEKLLSEVTEGAQTGAILSQMHFRNGFAPAGDKPDVTEYYPYRELFEKWNRLDKLREEQEKQEEDYEDYIFASHHPKPHQCRQDPWTRLFGVKEQDIIKVVRYGLQHVARDTIGRNLPAEPSLLERLRIRFPYVEMGKMKLVDPEEIDQFVAIKILIAKYLNQSNKLDKPLSLAVFGPPGSGKSFAIKQIRASIKIGEQSEELTYNLSQFRDIKDLAIAFHQIQDRALSDKAPPLVLFDEFDTEYESNSWGWLKYFLAPMQDGLFKSGESMYHVGRAIFVFAGGICETFKDFDKKYSPKSNDNEKKEFDKFKNAKGPDFVSRLRGYIDIKGINKEEGQEELTTSQKLRRAILLRAFLEKHCSYIINQNKVANINPGVINAFLKISKFEHGARSMEAIIEMSNIERLRCSFQKSSLPQEKQLMMHVDAEEFLKQLSKPKNCGVAKQGLSNNLCQE